MVSRLAPGAGVTGGRIVAIVRDPVGSHLLEACQTLHRAGVRAIEVTTNTPGAFQAVAALAGDGVEVGVGTVRTVAHVHAAAAAGASFIVAPSVSSEVGAAAIAAGLRWYPGAVTPTEIETAWRLGASAVKVFPVGTLGGPRYVRELRAPLDDIPLIPTGGVRIEDIGEYLAAGAIAVGMGSPLLGDAVASGEMTALFDRARQAVAAVTEVLG